MSSGAWGSGNYGAGSWGGGVGFGALILERAQAFRENVVRLTFSRTLYFSSILDPPDAANASKFIMSPVPGTSGIDGTPARSVTVVRVGHPGVDDGIAPNEVGRIFDLELDRAMTSFPAAYSLQIIDVFTTDLSASFSTTVQFPALFRQIVQPQVQTGRLSRDISNPQTLRGVIASGVAVSEDNSEALSRLGVFSVDSRGDYAIDEGPENLRKRIIRRLITRKNGFAHLPGYGVGIPDLGSQLAVAARLAAAQADAEAQIKQEPDVADVAVKAIVDPTGNGIVRFRVFARPKLGPPLNFEVPFRYTLTG